MFWEPASVLRHPDGSFEEYGLKNGRNGRMSPSLSLQTIPLKPFCNKTYWDPTSPLSRLSFDSLLPALTPSTTPLTTTAFTSPKRDTQFTRVIRHVPKQSSTKGINSLPVELLCLIFENYLTPPADDDDGADEDEDCATGASTLSTSPDFLATPLPLTHVCRHWRATAIAHKRLWSSIAVAIMHSEDDTPPEGGVGRGGLLGLLRLFLERASGALLTLDFVGEEGVACSVRETELVCQVLKLFGDHTSKWRRVSFDLPSVKAQQTLLETTRAARQGSSSSSSSCSSFPELQSLQVGMREEQADVHTQYALNLAIHADILRASPKLSELSIDDDFLAYLGTALEDEDGEGDDVVPWAQIKRLTIACSRISTRQLLSICEKGKGSLETLEVWRVEDGPGPVLGDGGSASPPPLAQITLPHLRTLDLTLRSQPHRLLATLVMPALQELKLDVQQWRNTEEPVELLAPVEGLVKASPTVRAVEYRMKSYGHRRCTGGGGVVSYRKGLEKELEEECLDKGWLAERGLVALAGVEDVRVTILRC